MKTVLSVLLVCFSLSVSAGPGDIRKLYPPGVQITDKAMKDLIMMLPAALVKDKVQQQQAHHLPVCRPWFCPCKYYPPPCNQ